MGGQRKDLPGGAAKRERRRRPRWGRAGVAAVLVAALAAAAFAMLPGAAGYATAAFLGAVPLHSRFGLNQSFDLYDDHFGETRAPTEFAMPERPATEVVGLARRWIVNRARQSADRPWFVWVHVF